MRTAIDTNVLSALWSKERSASHISRILGAAKAEGGLVVCGPVYAELLAYPKATESFVDDFLADTGFLLVAQAFLPVRLCLEQPVWVEASRRFARYAKRRLRSAGQGAKRLLADFIIGSHAMVHADRFMTLDPKRYARDFPELKLT